MEFNFSTKRNASEDMVFRVARAADDANKQLSYSIDALWHMVRMQAEAVDCLNYKLNAITKQYSIVLDATIPQKYRAAFNTNIKSRISKVDKLYNDALDEIYKDYGDKLNEIKKRYGLEQ